MNLPDDMYDIKIIKYQHRGVKEILTSLLNTPTGIHQIVVYPNLELIRETYFHYIKKLLEKNNEMVIFIPYYESSHSVKKILSSFPTERNEIDNDNKKGSNQKSNNIIDVKRYTHNGSLVIIESPQIFSNVEGETTATSTTRNGDLNKYNNNNNSIVNKKNNDNFSSLVRMSLSHAKKLKKEGITILADYGFIYEKKGFENLIELEKSIPPYFENIKIKQICLYHQKDFFNRFTKQQQKEILDLHSRSILMTDCF
jgi:hypothetical protein